MKADIWKLFKNTFKVGQEVVVVLDDGKFDWGKITAYDDNAITLSKGTGIVSHTWKWQDVRFIAHDGFPVKKILSPPSDEVLDQMDTTNQQDFIRKALSLTLCKTCSKQIPFDSCYVDCDECREKQRIISERSRSYGFGHPFLIESVSSYLVNPGNDEDPYHMDYLLETIVMESKDGARGHLWDLDSIFYFD